MARPTSSKPQRTNPAQQKRSSAAPSVARRTTTTTRRISSIVKRVGLRPARRRALRARAEATKARKPVSNPAQQPAAPPARVSRLRSTVSAPRGPIIPRVSSDQASRAPKPVGTERLAQQASRRRAEETFQLPSGYGDHRLVLMVKDPWWLYAYWEVQPDAERRARKPLKPEEIEGLQTVLRVYDVTDRDYPNQPAHRVFDIPLSRMATNWYIHVDAPNRSFLVELGLLTRQGRFLMLLRSNRVTTPRAGPSDVLDEEWMTSEEDFGKLVKATTGIGMGASPSGMRGVLERQLFSGAVTSPGLFSPGQSQRAQARGFWFWVNAELIVYGATDPKATVTFQGQPIALRPDGTFSVRLALPDGTQTIPVSATSPDRHETCTITPMVTRETKNGTLDVKPQTSARRSPKSPV